MPKRSRGVSIRVRTIAEGSLAYDVRWRERIDSELVAKCKTFRSLDEANVFAKTAQHRLMIVPHVRSLMEEEMKKPGELSVCIQMYTDHLLKKSKPGSLYSAGVKYDLTRNAKRMGWTKTNDIGERELHLLTDAYGRARASSAKAAQAWSGFLKWARRDYAVNGSYVRFRIKKVPATETYAWTEDERRMILQELSRPIPPEFQVRVPRHSPDFSMKIRAKLDFLNRQAFLPIFWLQVHWALRPYEASRLRVRDWDSRQRRIVIPRDVAKNWTQRSFIVDGRTASILDEVAKGRTADEFIFHSLRSVWTAKQQSRFMRRILRRLKLRGSLYSARHHATTMLCRLLKGELRKVQMITGHKTLSELQKYLHDLGKPDEAAALWNTHLDAVAAT
jgi:hypothetical protein